MDLVNKFLLDSEIDFLKKSFNLKKLNFFKDAIFSGTIENTKFFMFPFFSSDKNTFSDYQIIQSNFKKKLGSNYFTFWKCSINKSPGKNYYDFLFISDNPISIIKQFSNYFSSYKNKSILCIVPFSLNKKSVIDIKNKYAAKQIITVFDDNNTNEIQRLKVSAIYSDVDLIIEKKVNKIVFKRNIKGKEYEIKTSSIKNNLLIKNKIKHKSN